METNEIKVPRRILGALLSSLAAGVVPRSGAAYIAVGRDEEISALADDLDAMKEGGGRMRLLIGKYGSGKSFLMQLLRGYAIERDFVTSDCDLSPERRICGRAGTGIATFRELMKNLSCKACPDGGALQVILAKWHAAMTAALAEEGVDANSLEFDRKLTAKVYEVVRDTESQVGGFDFSRVIGSYFAARRDDDQEKASACLRWLRGEYNTRMEARRELGVGAVIDDDNWFDYIKLYAVFFRKIGFSGFLVMLDEGVNLYKISNRISRENNYEKLLSIFNDSLQGRTPGLGVILGGTPQFLEDPRRGLFSYEALRSRLCDSRIMQGGNYRNLMGPVIRLRRMSDNELLALCTRLTALYGQYHKMEAPVTMDQMKRFLAFSNERAGADSMITPREITREYLGILDVLLQNPSVTFDDLIAPAVERLKGADSDEWAIEEFEI
ncbi:MAG: biotin carboxylase [Ruminococcaceae bacterium]|nr:biotin carboxylase [Oscillospiraceae bacterium]